MICVFCVFKVSFGILWDFLIKPLVSKHNIDKIIEYLFII